MSGDTSAFPSLPWSDSFAVGLPELDADHREMVAQINAVCEAFGERQHEQALKILESLACLAEDHFTREAAVLAEVGETGSGALNDRQAPLTSLSQRAATADSDAARAAFCTDLIDWFLRQVIGQDAAIKARFDDLAPQQGRKSRPAKEEPDRGAAAADRPDSGPRGAE